MRTYADLFITARLDLLTTVRLAYRLAMLPCSVLVCHNCQLACEITMTSRSRSGHLRRLWDVFMRTCADLFITTIGLPACRIVMSDSVLAIRQLACEVTMAVVAHCLVMHSHSFDAQLVRSCTGWAMLARLWGCQIDFAGQWQCTTVCSWGEHSLSGLVLL